jgi:hypothetical protein
MIRQYKQQSPTNAERGLVIPKKIKKLNRSGELFVMLISSFTSNIPEKSPMATERTEARMPPCLLSPAT